MVLDLKPLIQHAALHFYKSHSAPSITVTSPSLQKASRGIKRIEVLTFDLGAVTCEGNE